MILMVDDTALVYAEELELSGYEVRHLTNVDDALTFFDSNFDQIELLILDIIMPPGNSFDREENQDGRRTGLYFYERVRRRASRLPVIILTVHSGEDVASRFCQETACWFYRKADILPTQFVQKVTEIFARSEMH